MPLRCCLSARARGRPPPTEALGSDRGRRASALGTDPTSGELKRVVDRETVRRRAEVWKIRKGWIGRPAEMRRNRGDTATRSAVGITKMVNGVDSRLEGDDCEQHGERRRGDPERPSRQEAQTDDREAHPEQCHRDWHRMLGRSIPDANVVDTRAGLDDPRRLGSNCGTRRRGRRTGGGVGPYGSHRARQQQGYRRDERRDRREPGSPSHHAGHCITGSNSELPRLTCGTDAQASGRPGWFSRVLPSGR